MEILQIMTRNELVILMGLITFALILWNLFISIKIVEELKKRGMQVKIAHRRGAIFKHLKTYRDITTEETGKPGPLYNRFIWSFVLFSFCLLVGIIMSAVR